MGAFSGQIPDIQKKNNLWALPETSLPLAKEYIDKNNYLGKSFISEATAIAKTGFGEKRISNLLKEGKILGYYFKGRWFIDEQSINEYVKSINVKVKFLKISDFANNLGTNTNIIYIGASSGKIPGLQKKDGKWAFPETSLPLAKEYIDKNNYWGKIFITKETAKTRTGLSERRINKFIKEGKILGYKFKNKCFIDEQSINDYIKPIDVEKYMTAEEIAQKENIPIKKVINRIISGSMLAIRGPKQGQFYIRGEDYEDWKYRSNRKVSNEDLFLYETRNYLDPKKIETFKLYHLYFIEYLSKNNRNKKRLYSCFN